MPYLIGTDEAGYGPNLGPLVIGATAWRVPDDCRAEQLYDQLQAGVCVTRSNEPDDRLQIADSKVLYSGGKGLATLERSVLAAVQLVTGGGPDDAAWNGPELHGRLESQTVTNRVPCPWNWMPEQPLPLACKATSVATGAKVFASAMRAAGVELVAVRCRTVFPAEFNELVAIYDSKGEALSRVTLGLAAELLAALPPEPALILCDRHGGRTRYAGLLQTCFPDHFVEVRHESPATSQYRWGPEECRIQAQFHVGGEAFLPIALASMTAKYVRELSMRAFNEFWCAQVADLRPTAGYPEDARRFKSAIAAKQAELGIVDHILWRNR